MSELDTGRLRDIGHLAVWSVSSAKPGNGVELLRDGRTDTFWQSDGQQPHTINIQFQKKETITEIQMYLDYTQDESYTPKEVAIRVGTCFHDLKEVKLLDLAEPQGWVKISLLPEENDMEGSDTDRRDLDVPLYERTLKAFFVQVVVISNCLKGRDTHIRAIKLLGPRTDPSFYLGLPCIITTPELGMYSCVR